MSSIRVVLTITPANPELFAGLQEVPARLRAERVRTLATLGIAAISGGIVGTRPAASPVVPLDKGRHGGSGRALAFAKSLGDGV